MRLSFIKSGIILLFVITYSQLSAQQVLDRMIAIVDDDIILESQVTQGAYYAALQMGIDPAKNPQDFQDLKQQTLKSLINKELMLIQADKDTVIADERQVDTYLQQDLQRVTQQVGGEDKIEESLGMPMSKFRRTRRQEIEKEMRVSMVREQKFANLKVSSREVKEFYNAKKDSLGTVQETVDISHILVTPKPGKESRENALKRAQAVRELVVDKGYDFAEMAKEYSEDPGSAQKGGDLGFVSRSTLVREYAEAASRLEPGEFSQIVESQFGFHIIKLIEKRGEKIHTQHILISIKPTEKDEMDTVELIKKIHSELENGADFEKLVKEYSEDESSNKQDGHLGRFEIDQLKQMAKEFSYGIENVQPGEYSDPIKTQFGYHVIKVNSREKAREYDLNKDWDMIEGMALEYKKQLEYQEWLNRIKKDIYLEVKEPYTL